MDIRGLDKYEATAVCTNHFGHFRKKQENELQFSFLVSAFFHATGLTIFAAFLVEIHLPTLPTRLPDSLIRNGAWIVLERPPSN
jgi:hypothetical protein